jgi:hypothetical protein
MSPGSVLPQVVLGTKAGAHPLECYPIHFTRSLWSKILLTNHACDILMFCKYIHVLREVFLLEDLIL